MQNKVFTLQFAKSEVNENNDRRSNQDRRKSFKKNYFLNGEKDRRNGKERRFIWYMTQ